MSKPVSVGITGGIGSGKTTVARIFEALGIPVFIADDEAKKILHNNSDVKAGLVELFGNDVLNQDGSVNTTQMAEKMFPDASLRAKVNALIHPKVGAAFEAWREKQKAPYVLKEAAILFETGSYKQNDFNILITAPEKLRIERVMKRNGFSEAQVRERMKTQWTDEEKTPLADFVIENDGDQMLIPQVMKVHDRLMLVSRR